jgi:hypothetical protein
METEGILPRSQESVACPYAKIRRSSLYPLLSNVSKTHFNIILPSTLEESVWFRGFFEYFVIWLIFYGEELLAPRPASRLEYHPFSSVRDCLFNIFAATLHNWRLFLHPQPEDAPCRGWWQGPIYHALYSSPNIIRVIKSRRLRWAGHVARMGERRGANGALMGKPEWTRPLERLRRRREDNIKMDLREVGWGGGAWTGSTRLRIGNAVMNLRVPQNAGNFLSSSGRFSYTGRTLLHGVSK